MSNSQPIHNKRIRIEIDDTISSFKSAVITPKQSQIDCIQQEGPTYLPINISEREDIDYNVDSMSYLQFTFLQQYANMLLKKQQLYHLDHINIIMFPDYSSTNGIISLKKNLIRIDSLTNLCKTCLSISCLHCQVAEKCFFEFSHLFTIIQSCNYQNTEYFLLNNETIVIPDTNSDLHIYVSTSHKWHCDTCSRICKHKKVFESLISAIGPALPTQTELPIKYKTVSCNSIPFSLTEQQSKIYEEQLINGFQFPLNLTPDVKQCKNGYAFSNSNLHRERKSIVIYFENDIRELNEHSIYSVVCDGDCKCKVNFNGEKFLLLNLDNHYLIHYSLLFEYSELMTLSKNPLFSYIRAKNNKLARMGRQQRYKYHIVQHAWNAYIRTVDINYQSTFQCPTCNDKPPIIILDGIAMGTTKSLPHKPEDVDYTQKFQLIALNERTFIPSVESRKALSEYAERGIVAYHFCSMIDTLKQPEFANYIRYTSIENNNLRIINPIYTGVVYIIKLLARVEPINALFRFSAITSNERKLILAASQGTPVSLKELIVIYDRLNSLETLVNSIRPTIDNINEVLTLHDVVAKLLIAILRKTQNLITKPTRKLISEPTSETLDFFNYFPSLPYNYKIPHYEGENADTISRCTKLYPKHNKFSPGLLVIACQHRYCYGFEIMASRESTIVVYNLLLRKFKVPPEVIIYDNACNLQTTCMMRDPALFRNTTFLVDRFHNRNHICNPIFSMDTFKSEDVIKINSQVCEQLFSILRRIGTQISYMRIENIYYNTRYFLACFNNSVNSKNSKM